VHCLGRCYAAPATTLDRGRPFVEVVAPQAIVLGRVAAGGATTLDGARAQGGFSALDRALELTPEQVVDEVSAARLRGRGGGGYPAGHKWRAVRAAPAGQKFVVCNADEGDPGAYIDRFLLEDDPFCVLEAMAIAAYAVGADRGYVYVRKEYPEAHAALARAITSARDAGYLGERILGTKSAFDVELVPGAGSFVAGEETAILDAIEGRRLGVRTRPPYPSSRGVFDRPTLVHNVETLASVPWILRHGGDAYAALGHGDSRGTKVVSLNSLFERPGLFEVELGTPLARVVHELGGGLRDGPLAGVIVGGPLAAPVPPHLLEVPLTFEDLAALGAALGHGGVVAFDGQTSIAQLVHHVFRFGAYESCGMCTPCRVGADEVEENFRLILDGDVPGPAGRARWDGTVGALGATSLCGHGAGLAEFAEGVARHYPKELASCFG
jgi:NADH:ubiquinone oxidoreductase subunit F (NADH-binding)